LVHSSDELAGLQADWSPADRELWAILGAACTPTVAKYRKKDGTLALGCAPEGELGDAPVDVMRVVRATVLPGNFRASNSDDAVVVQGDGKRTWLTREAGAWKKAHERNGPETVCRVAEGDRNKDLLVCVAALPALSGGSVEYSVIGFDEKSSKRVARLPVSMDDPWALLCRDGGVSRQSYIPQDFTLHQVAGDAGADLEISVRRVGWTSVEAERLRKDAKVQASCACKAEGDACKEERAAIPREDFVLTFIRKGDDFVAAADTQARLDEIKRQRD
jgi:hypothetical protein